MTLSRRFAPLLIVLLLITGGFVARSVGEGSQMDPCRDPAALKRLDLVPGTRRAFDDSKRRTSRRRQWTNGIAGTGAPDDPFLAIQMVRDFGLFSLWLHPTAGIPENFIPDEERLVFIETDAGELPVHMNYRYSGARPRLVAYTYVYGLEPAAHPARVALRNSFRAVVEGARPLTLMLVSGSIEHGRLPVLRAASFRWLRAAFERYAEVCGP